MITAIVLAAGASTRMGSPKALLELDGATYLERVVATARAAGVSSVTVVAGPPHGALVQARLPAFAGVVWNPDPSRGMLSSIQAGIASLPPGTVAALVWPVDHPLVTVATVEAVLRATPGRIVVPRHGGRGGHPVRLPQRLFGEILALPTEASLKQLIAAHAAEVVSVAVDDEAAVSDIDTPAEHQRALDSRKT